MWRFELNAVTLARCPAHDSNTPKAITLAILDQRLLSGKGFRAGEIGLPYSDEGCQSLGSARLIWVLSRK
jgi:hypothetical protein